MGYQKKGRPPVKAIVFMDGYYIEVRNRGSKDKGVRIRSVTQTDMERMISNYRKNKDIIVLGEHRNEKWVSQPVSLLLP